MKAFIYEDDLFCWVCVVIAVTELQAREIAADAGHNVIGITPRVEPLKIGLVVVGGGNG